MAKSEERELFDKAISKKIKKKKISAPIIFIIVFTMLYSLSIFIYNILVDSSTFYIINSLLLLVFNIIFVSLVFKTLIKNNTLLILSNLILIIIYTFNLLCSMNIINLIKDPLYNKDIIEIIDYSKKNKLNVNYDYEYSDLIKENHLISYIENDNNLDVSISLGSNPDKVIYLPNMVSWRDEDVLNYLINKKINNVKIKYISSDKLEDTLVTQSINNHMKRSDELKLEFSYGNEISIDNCKVRNLIGMSLVEVVMYLEKNHLNYELVYDYSNKYDKNIVFDQSIEPGEIVKINDKPIKISISKGKKIEMINLENKDIYDATKWLVDNKLIVKYEYKYNSKVKKNKIIKTSIDEDDELTSFDVVTLYVSKGSLIMKDFKNIDEFKKWAIDNEISYIEEYEFSDKYNQGEIIKYSVKHGDSIDSDDVITVVISDGKKIKMPNLVGLNKNDAIKKLDDNKIKYNIDYKKGDKDKVLSQSIREGSEISDNTTVSLIIGK